MKADNEQFFLARKGEVDSVISHVSVEKKDLEGKIANPRETFAKLSTDEREKFHFFHALWTASLHSAKFLEKSPFFSRIVVKFDDKNEEERIYIGKFSFLQDKVYSWTVPVASLRYAPLGPFSYVRPNGQRRSGTVIGREDYFIANGKIVSLHNVTSAGRELVYDEHISAKKTGFGLTDIVRELERAQNEIIVLDPKGVMVISGPAGSGKTTLALHRVAYLLQNPDTSDTYTPEQTIVFIQDASSIGYFSSLFVNLGVENVHFTTFEAWCISVLSLPGTHSYVDRYGHASVIRDWYEWNKVGMIASFDSKRLVVNDPWKTLDAVYAAQNDQTFMSLWKQQKAERVLDKQDLTAIMKIQVAADKGKVLVPKRVFRKRKGVMVPVHTRVEASYDTILVDEFENYTADQLGVIVATQSAAASCLLVGDIRQQTKFGSVSDFSQTQIHVSTGRNIVLSKVYRNSLSVLEMLSSLGYRVGVDSQNGVRGTCDWVVGSRDDHEDRVRKYLSDHAGEQVGIVCFDEDAAEGMKGEFSGVAASVHVGVVTEFQGLEFDTVFILGVDRDLFTATGLDAQFDEERSIIMKERLYVAITRARENVVIFSDSKKEAIKDFVEVAADGFI